MLGCPPVESEGEIGILLNVCNSLVVTGILAWDREASQVIVHRDVYFKHFQALSHTVTGMALKM